MQIILMASHRGAIFGFNLYVSPRQCFPASRFHSESATATQHTQPDHAVLSSKKTPGHLIIGMKHYKY
jgi:hypothetical protein